MNRVRLWGCMLAANALDLGSSLCLHGADQQRRLPSKPEWLLLVQVALLLPLLAWIARALPRVARALRALQVGPLAQLAIAAVLVVQVAHVALRSEHYPFSAVTMFSDYVPDAELSPEPLSVFVVDGPHGPEAVSLLREGNPWFSRFLQLDYKAGWLLGTHAQGSAASTSRVAAMIAQGGGRNPRLRRVELDPHDGALRVQEPYAVAP